MNCDVIILAGGLGTRLAHIVQDLPKPMAPINGKPFLSILFDQILSFKFQRIILSVGHKSDKIEEYFGSSYSGIELIYSKEESPLGTGGAIKKAISHCNSEYVFILNGDTYFDIDFNSMFKMFSESSADMAIAVKELKDFDRYGTVSFQNNIITGFAEKKKTSRGYINGGTYLMNLKKINTLEWPDKFSFEKNFLELRYKDLKFMPFISDKYFIDIGIPEDYERACSYFKS